MKNRNPVSVSFNKWSDGQRVDRDDMVTEQSRNIQIDAGIIQNHFGSGVLPDSIDQKILFDSDDLTQAQSALLVSGDFDGTGLDPKTQPTDSNLGEQLEVELTGAYVGGRFSVKVLVIGLDFQGQPQYDRFEFYKNEKQLSKKHYTRILSIFFNDFKGNNNCSRALGGRITVKEVQSYQLSRDAISVAQDLEPNLFFRDFKISGIISGSNPTVSLYETLQDGMGPEYSVDALNIQTTVKQNRYLEAGDVTTKIGQKFKAKTNNIQKVTLLLGVNRDDSAVVANRYDWSGDIVVSIYPLQTTVSCPGSLVPELSIDFDPVPEPIVQLSLNQTDLREMGYVLTDILQPVDFVFSDTKISSTINTKLVKDKYYAITINRSGAANTGDLFTAVGNNVLEDSRLTLYNSSWVDVPEEDLWFRIYSDAAKVADGQAYDAGNGIQIDKVAINTFGATVDYALDGQSFADTGEGTTNIAIVQAVNESFQEEQDERTGNPIYSRQKMVPSFSFVTNSTLDTIRNTQDPLIIGAAQDINPKRNPTITGTSLVPGLAKGDVFRILNPDADLLSNNLLGSNLIPNTDNAAKEYKITNVKLCQDGYGDINGDGTIDNDDIIMVTALVGESLYFQSTQTKISNGEIDVLHLLRADVDGDGYVTSSDVNLITDFVSRDINSFPVGTYFTHLELGVQQAIGRYDGYHNCDGYYIRVDGTSQNIVPWTSFTSKELEYFGFIQTPDIDGSDSDFISVPYQPLDFEIKPLPFWQDYLLLFSSSARFVPAAFGFSESLSVEECENVNEAVCVDRNNRNPEFEPGRNDIMIPDNLVIRHGQILNPNGTHYKVDLEINHIILKLPEIPLQENVIDVFHKLIADSGNGMTSGGFPAMRFSDCSTVKTDALAKGQVKFGVAVQAFNPNLDGYSVNDGYGIIVDDVIGIYMDHSTGLLTLTIKDLSVDPIYLTLVTKIEITVYLKKAGWVNNTLIVEPGQVQGLLL